MIEIDISESYLEIKEFLQFNNKNSMGLSLNLELDCDAHQIYFKLKQLILILEILEHFRYPISFINFEKMSDKKIKIILSKYSPLNSVLGDSKRITQLNKVKNLTKNRVPSKLDNLSLIKFLSNFDTWRPNKKYLKDFLSLIVNGLEKTYDQTFNLSHEKISETKIAQHQINTRKLKVAVVMPIYTPLSAGIRVLHRLSNKLKQEGATVYELLYDTSKSDANGNISIDKSTLGDFKDCITIVPETIRALPFNPRKTVQYFLNTKNNLPSYSLGRFPVIASQQFSYSSAIYPEMPRLFIEVLNYKPFYFNIECKPIEFLVYFGKMAQFQGTQKHRIDLAKTIKKPYFEITRDWPDTNLIPLLLASSMNLISFDPLSAINHEASLYGCSTHIIFDKSDVGMAEKLESYELNNPLIHVYTDISQVKTEVNLDSIFQNNLGKSILNLAQQIEQEDFLKFLQTLIKMQN
jgi:hypothetical protein